VKAGLRRSSRVRSQSPDPEDARVGDRRDRRIVFFDDVLSSPPRFFEARSLASRFRSIHQAAEHVETRATVSSQLIHAGRQFLSLVDQIVCSPRTSGSLTVHAYSRRLIAL